MSRQHFRLERDCEAVAVPAGMPVRLKEGTEVQVTQARGGAFTVRTSEGLFLIGRREVEALGPEAEAAMESGWGGEAPEVGLDPVAFNEEDVWAVLRECHDPEIPVNIVDLGLIYSLALRQLEDGRWHVGVTMTLTAQGCGMGPTIAAEIRSRLEALPAVASAETRLVWDPQWTPHMISEAGRRQLGLD